MNRLFAAATACLLSSGAAMAQTPVNFPPSDFEGRQFVDNKGCAYIRVGVGPTVDWVPRMTRSRDQVCGLQPTFRTPTQTVEAPAAPTPTPTRVKPAPQPAAKTATAAEPAPAPAPKVAKAKPTPAPAPTVIAAPKVAAAKPAAPRAARNAPMATVASTVVARPQAATTTVLAPTTVVSGQPVKTAPATPVAKTASVCPSRTGVSAQYTNSDGVRCGPQSAAPVTVVSVGGANQPLPNPPKGYVRVWQDDRLNPYRGPRTAEGNAQSNAVWDTKTPRNLRKDAPTQTVQVAAPATSAVQGVGRYVQVATFSVPANAQRTAGRFQAAGFPVRLMNMRNGQQIVLVGAVQGGSLEQTLASARKAGFADAYIR